MSRNYKIMKKFGMNRPNRLGRKALRGTLPGKQLDALSGGSGAEPLSIIGNDKTFYKRFVQLINPRSGNYVLVDIKKGAILGHSSTPWPCVEIRKGSFDEKEHLTVDRGVSGYTHSYGP